MTEKYWRMITCAIGGIGSSYCWTDSNFNFKWDDGKPPIGVGIYCDDKWKPLKDLSSISGASLDRIKYSEKKSDSYWKKFGCRFL
jgi:hypothetical protein